MKNYIKNIKLENDYIVIMYKNQKKEKIFYNKKNKETIINSLKDEKKYLLKEKRKVLEKFLGILVLNIISLTLTILSYIFYNTFLLKFVLSILTFYLSLLSFFVSLYLKLNHDNLKDILNIIKEEKLPNEDIYLANKKIINIEYLLNKYAKYKTLYSNVLKQDNSKTPNQSNNILEFKRK